MALIETLQSAPVGNSAEQESAVDALKQQLAELQGRSKSRRRRSVAMFLLAPPPPCSALFFAPSCCSFQHYNRRRPLRVTPSRAMGIEPTYSAWKADALPLSYARSAPGRSRGAGVGERLGGAGFGAVERARPLSGLLASGVRPVARRIRKLQPSSTCLGWRASTSSRGPGSSRAVTSLTARLSDGQLVWFLQLLVLSTERSRRPASRWPPRCRSAASAGSNTFFFIGVYSFSFCYCTYTFLHSSYCYQLLIASLAVAFFVKDEGAIH